MKYLILLIFFMALPVYGGVSEVIDYAWPVEREDGTPLPISELSHMSIYEFDCVSGELLYPWPFNKVPPSTKFIMQTQKDLICFKFTAVDTEGRESAYSEIFKVGTANPGVIECVPKP